MKIAVQLDENRIIINTYLSPESGAVDQVNKHKDEGWLLVENDAKFSSGECFKWTVRADDNVLVHISTGLTPDEETKALLSELTKSQLKGQLMAEQVQQAITAVTKQAVQDKLTSQMAITELTKQVADLTAKLDKANGVDSAPETPTDVTSTATKDGATIAAK